MKILASNNIGPGCSAIHFGFACFSSAAPQRGPYCTGLKNGCRGVLVIYPKRTGVLPEASVGVYLEFMYPEARMISLKYAYFGV